jgi:DNA invertase Pin-like site-specific DNA recombinase
LKIVTYARVSTIGQERKGQSLPNQERAFSEHIKRSGDVRLRAYQESASGKSIEGRAEFSRMIRELPELKPDAIVVDTLDRFTRNATDGLVTVRALRGHSVALLPLDWHRAAPINLDDDRDWQEIYDEFGAAAREHRRISRRVRRSYEGRRERGATTHSHPPFGLKKVGDRLEPHPETAWIIRDLDAKFIAGESQRDLVHWLRSVTAGQIGSRRGVRNLLANGTFVIGGLRSPDTHAAIQARIRFLAAKFGSVSTHDSALTGVVACGRCLDRGVPMNRSLMCASWQKTNKTAGLVCHLRGHSKFQVTVDLIEPLFAKFLERWQAPSTIERWAVEPTESEHVQKIQDLNRRLSGIEQREAVVKSRRDAALDLLSDPSATMKKQGKKALLELESDERSLGVERGLILAEIANTPAPAVRQPEDAAALLEGLVETYWALELRERNELARALCQTLGSHPRVSRKGKKSTTISLTWPELAAFEVSTINQRLDDPRPKIVANARPLDSSLATR